MFNPYYNPFAYVIEKRTSQFVLAMLLCVVISYIPFVRIPYNWYSHFFHELAQGLTALITDGEFSAISFDLRGNVQSDFNSYPLWLSIFAGYLGNVIGGVLVYYAGESWPAHIANFLTAIVVLMIAFTGFFFSDTGYSLLVSVLFSLIFSILMPLRIWMGGRIIFKCAGIYMVMMVLKVPADSLFFVLDGDARQLSDITSIPASIWIMGWVMIGITGLRFLWINHCVKGW